ncbi:MAG: biotin--[acetyl-CoA-carboxylase] ligase [Chloroflexi bacterium]|nr:biotin--[acetyl-CoA-carboxylase] ligase [Chloroflexota bacterium]
MTDRTAIVAPLTDWSAAVRARSRIGHTLEVHDSIGSTNDRARELLLEPGGDGSVVLAEVQTAGRGRRGRTWVSPSGLNLTLTVALRPALSAPDAWQLGLAAALATLEACRDAVAGAGLGLKWPNDVVAGDGRKVAGLLLETVMTGERLTGAVVGMGVNVNWQPADMPPDIAGHATSLSSLAGGEVDRVSLLDRLLDSLDDEIVRVEAGRSPLARYRAACVTLGRDVAVDIATGVVRGTAVDLDETGSLVLEAEGGRIALSAGEVTTVRGGQPP